MMTTIHEDEANGHTEVVTFHPKPSAAKGTLAVVLGRFQPLHFGHTSLIDKAIGSSDLTLVIACSASESPSQTNPLTVDQRLHILEQVFGDSIIASQLDDYKYDDDRWYAEAIKIMRLYAGSNYDIVIKAAVKPGDTATSDVYKGFEERGMKVDYVEVEDVINATDIRNMLFCGVVNWAEIKRLVPIDAYDFLVSWSHGKSPFKSIEAEWKATREYKRSWEGSPFPPVFVAVDGLCLWYDKWNKPHILLIERKSDVGNGKLALPGGFLEVDETIYKSAIREVREETTLDVSDWALNDVRVFDAPKRSLRGRMITHVHHWEPMVGGTKKPKVKGEDDAGHAFWMPIDEIRDNRHRFFADHWHIIRTMIPEVEQF